VKSGGVVVPGVVAAFLAALLAWLHLTLVAFALCEVVALAAVVLIVSSWPRTSSEQLERSSFERGTVVGASAAIAVTAAGMYAWDLLGGWHLDTATQWPWRGMVLALMIGALTLFISSLIDWSYIVPRLCGSGDLPGLPCLTSTEPRWRDVTRVWLAHRIAAYVIVRTAMVVAVLFFIASFHPQLPTGTASALAALLVAVIIYYVNQLIPLGALISNPPIQVGDRIVLAEEFGTGVSDRPIYYIVDVGIEGAKLLELETGDAPRDMELVRTHDRMIALTDIANLLRERSRFAGCRSRCTKASSRCPLNLGDPTDHLVEFDRSGFEEPANVSSAEPST
jgi:MFS family permease